ncbi:hypothetical protein A2707_03440 [Candidatus Saccharibacteria bacterium RIFCSPHIGHO2_01_FULL_45_15]|nr:MAG: hypothetical protein A2707_03440 [Candidatus Saccharibacteria bacterium RIFCSPHIGHO2_01_FULL_45_15]OGL28591.1 MAG: hypothetical protein A3C39_03090 [Candidatus Saccharibacteria bacterium RIFCSPHIGHO2_02_FULL_46_12]OGL32448.1 MAG: hypothetical protein A3E76_00125 [Candidatus Saccharibacteria bacterium RIFCSPHIGHO2_12_FULL_44_22]
MTLTSSIAIIFLAALIHASFQLSVSVLTLMSGHSIGKRTAHAKLLRMVFGFILGVAIMTMLLVSFSATIVTHVFDAKIPMVLWAMTCGVLVGVGVSVWRFYYRPGKGTTLWIPRDMAKFLNDRSKSTKQSSEAFGLGLSTLFAELLFIGAPIVLTSLVLVQLSPTWQLGGILIYTAVSSLPLLIVGALIGSGHKLSHIQRWRESNKHFLQFAAGSGLLVLGVYVYIDQVISTTVTAIVGGL